MQTLKIFKTAYPEEYEVYKAEIADIFGDETLQTLVARYEQGHKLTEVIDSDIRRFYTYQKHISCLKLISKYIPLEISVTFYEDLMNYLLIRKTEEVTVKRKRQLDYLVKKLEAEALKDKAVAKGFIKTFANYY
jgi:hypothetical protein